MRALRGSTDFTKGNIIRAIVLFSLPIVAGELLQNLYNSVDALVVGNLVSETALAAVTVGGVVSNMLVNFFNGMSVGANVVIARAFGEGDTQTLRSRVRIAFTFAVLLGVALSALGILLTPQLLHFAGAQPDYYGEALTYLRIYLAGLMFTVIYNNGAGILRAIGNSGTPFRILALTCALNVLLDLLFVAVFHLGVAGVGLATVCSQALSVALVYRAIGRELDLQAMDLRALRGSGATIAAILRVGLTAGMQSALIGFSNLFVVRYMNLFSTEAVAGIGIAQRLDKFIVLPAKSFGITMTTYVSQNLGAARYDRLREGKRRCLLVSLVVTVSLSALVFVFARQISMLFNSNGEVVAVSTAMVHVFTPLFWIMAIREIYLGLLRGYGKNLVPMLLSLAGIVGVRQLFLALTMRGPSPQIEYIYWCWPLAWAATLVFQTVYYLAVRRTLPGMTRETETES